MEKKQNPPDPSPDKRRRSSQEYLKYSGMAFQMGGTILAFVLLGRWLDGRTAGDTHYWTIGLALVGITTALYVGLKDFISTGEDDPG